MTLPFREIPFSHHKAAVYPWESWSKFLVAGCPSSHQPTRIREEMLESGGPLQRKLNFRLRTVSKLHWLPVASRNQFKIATLTHKILSTGNPSYLSSLLYHYQPTRQLRSSSSNLLVQPPSKSKFGSLAFHTAAPLIWNGLPADVGSSPFFQPFKKMLKTYYFRSPPT